ncbi:WASP family protein CYBJADRAFT_125257, partial [Cyberlindnera jadinii NRRL Y-1542]
MGLTTAQKDKVKRVIPKASQKVLDGAIARLYIAYPDPQQWTYTGLSGAVVLVDDLVGHSFFLKLVDIHGQRGVVWDQELYVDFQYNQDRSFFHTFELEDCLAGLLFDDTSDATHFYKRVCHREKHGSKKTVNNKQAIALKKSMPEESRAPGPRGELL